MANGAMGLDVEFGELQSRRRFWISEVAVATGLPVSFVGSFWRSRSSILSLSLPSPLSTLSRPLSTFQRSYLEFQNLCNFP